ncbi:MAG: TraR/DksA C4-type zinc finger protein [Planctomycetaceae bacterium]|nr:TraR/DksA C4-type zinc finger protein [Planctomycetaceae bacterium]
MKKPAPTVHDKNAGTASDDKAGSSIPKKSTWMTPDQLAQFRKLLLKKLAEITGDVDHIELGALKVSRGDAAGDLSSMPIHMADIGSDNYEQEFALGLMDSERHMVQEIIAALKRIENGTYGICEGTGQPIPLSRLTGIPWARYCVKYAQMIEKSQPSQFARPQGGGDSPEHDETASRSEQTQAEDNLENEGSAQ